MQSDRNGGLNDATASPISRVLAPSLLSLALLSGCGGGDKHRPPPMLVLGDELSTETVAFADGAGLHLQISSAKTAPAWRLMIPHGG